MSVADPGDRVCVVTGANSGVGEQAAMLLGARGATVALVCRDPARGEAARARLAGAGHRVTLEIADLARLDDVRALAARLAAAHPAIHALINNAGVYRAAREITVDGFETTFATNHLAHYLLTRLLAAPLAAGGARVVNVSSGAHRTARLTRAPLEDIARGRVPYNGIVAYGDSKLANILFTRALAARWPATGVTTCALHPGVLATRIWHQNDNWLSRCARLCAPLMSRPARGGEAVLHALGSPAAVAQGAYFQAGRVAQTSAAARDPQLADELWRLSARLTGLPD